MSKYIKVSEQEKIFLNEVNKVGVIRFTCAADGKFDYYALLIANGQTRYWKTKDADFQSKLRIVERSEDEG